MTTFIIVRHGESMGNAENLFAGHTNLELTGLGKLQAQKTAEYLQKYKIDAIYSSDLIRAFDTARYTAKMQGKPVTAISDLREIYGGDWEGHKYYELAHSGSKNFTYWMNNIDDGVCDGGESTAQMKKRMVDAIDRIARENSGKTVAVFSHAVPIKALFSRWMGMPMTKIDWVKNSSVTVVEYDSPDKVKFVLTDYTGHLDGMVTFLPDDIAK